MLLGSPSGIKALDQNLLLRFEGPDFYLRGLAACASKGTQPRGFRFSNFDPPPFKFTPRLLNEWCLSNWHSSGELENVSFDQTFERISIHGRSCGPPILIVNKIATMYPCVTVTLKHMEDLATTKGTAGLYRYAIERVLKDDKLLEHAYRKFYLDDFADIDAFLEL